MPWFLMALTTALCETGRDLVVRHLIRVRGLGPNLVMGSSCLLTAALAAPMALELAPAPDWQALAMSLMATAVVNGVAFWAYGRALGRGDLSLVLPLINLSPVVLLLSGWILLGERPGGWAMAGVLMVAIGALELGRTTGSPGSLWGAPGARSMLLVAVLWGIGASVDKLGVIAAGSLTWVVALNSVVGLLLLLLPAVLGGRAGPFGFDHGPGWLGWLVLMAVLGLVGMALQMEALQHTAVVHVIAIKRLSTLFSALVGVLGLGEPRGTVRLPAAALMLAGALVVLRFAAV